MVYVMKEGTIINNLSKVGIKNSLKTTIIGNEVIVFDLIDSTNKYIKDNINTEGIVVVANEQSQGVGRKGRSFLSPAEGVYFSFVIKPNIEFNDVQSLTICVAVAVTNALENIFGFKPDIKWVNDIYYESKKLCGILTELTISKETKLIDKIIIGIGLNTGSVDDGVKDIATSIAEIVDVEIDRNKIIAEILNEFEKIYINNILRKDINSIIDTYKSRLFILGKTVFALQGDTSYECKVLDMGEKGELIVETLDGETVYLNSGEVSIKF